MDAKHSLGEPRVLVSGSALRHNLRLVRRELPHGPRICAIVKAEASGHGAATVAEATADRFVTAARTAIDERGVFRVALSGGSTPRLVYPLLLEPSRRDAVEWKAVEFFWGDERAVPPDHPESNFGVAYGMLIS